SGRCRGCRTKISWQYPLVEAATGAAFVVAYYAATSLVGFVLTAALLCVYIIIVTYDARHKIIPDFFSYLAAFISLGLIGATWLATGSIDPYRVIAGPALFLFFWAFWYFSKGTWMGLGDGKLALSIGWALGLSEGVAALLFSFWIGAIISLAVIGVQKLAGGRSSASRRLGMKSEIPFGPFLIIGFLIVFIWHVDIQAILSYLAV
ncbi:MAG: prepilin peptidase, partial [Patescibacteria group bacterium]|nr:prepilin peptidase [Patescibacteria group bacterium]